MVDLMPSSGMDYLFSFGKEKTSTTEIAISPVVASDAPEQFASRRAMRDSQVAPSRAVSAKASKSAERAKRRRSELARPAGDRRTVARASR